MRYSPKHVIERYKQPLSSIPTRAEYESARMHLHIIIPSINGGIIDYTASILRSSHAHISVRWMDVRGEDIPRVSYFDVDTYDEWLLRMVDLVNLFNGRIHEYCVRRIHKAIQEA